MRFLVSVIFLIGSYQTLKGAVIIRSLEKPCLEGSIILKQQVDAPVRLSILRAVCEEYSSNIDLKLENLSPKTITLYEILHNQDFENKSGGQSFDMNSTLIKPGESITVNVNSGISKRFQQSFGMFKTQTIKISWVKFSDGTLWGEDYGRSNPKEPRGYDLTLRDDKEPFTASFEFENNTFAIGSDREYGFGGPGLKVETNGCKKHITFDFRWRDYNYSYRLRKKSDETITIKAGDNLRGEFTYDSCTKTATGTIRNENQNLTLMNLNGTNITLRNDLNKE
jgi:hypothetical protein